MTPQEWRIKECHLHPQTNASTLREVTFDYKFSIVAPRTPQGGGSFSRGPEGLLVPRPQPTPLPGLGSCLLSEASARVLPPPTAHAEVF